MVSQRDSLNSAPPSPRYLNEFARPGTRFEIRQQAIGGDYAYIIWEAETADNIYELGSDTYVIRDGKIVFQSFAGKIVPK